MAQLPDDLSVDQLRSANPETGIFVRAMKDGKLGSHDIAHLDRMSLVRWLRGGGGHNMRAENVVAILLSHGTQEVEEDKGKRLDQARLLIGTTVQSIAMQYGLTFGEIFDALATCLALNAKWLMGSEAKQKGKVDA